VEKVKDMANVVWSGGTQIDANAHLQPVENTAASQPGGLLVHLVIELHPPRGLLLPFIYRSH